MGFLKSTQIKQKLALQVFMQKNLKDENEVAVKNSDMIV